MLNAAWLLYAVMNKY